MELSEDPFLEAGIDIPTELPDYVNRSSKATYFHLHRQTPTTAEQGIEANLNKSSSEREGFLGRFKVNNTGVIYDPQMYNPEGSDHYSHLKVVSFSAIYGRTDNVCVNRDHYRA